MGCACSEDGVSIHAPYIGSDSVATLIMTRMTSFNPRSLHRERRCGRASFFRRLLVSIHAPYIGSDAFTSIYFKRARRVSIHAPYIGSDEGIVNFTNSYVVSIHAPYIGSDKLRQSSMTKKKSFNPRSLHRERPYTTAAKDSGWKFQSTLPT